jgi:hypothetical protein
LSGILKDADSDLSFVNQGFCDSFTSIISDSPLFNYSIRII